MANLKTVQVPAEVKLQVANQAQVMRNLYKDFQDIFASVDPGSAFGKSIAKAFSKVESKLSASEGLLGNEFFSEADLRKVATQLSSISELFGQINIQARGVSANTLGLDTTEIENAEKHLKQLQERVRELKGAKVGTLLGVDSKDLQEFAKLSKTTGFNGGKSYTENYKSMEAAVGRVTEKYGQLTIEAQGAEEALRQANEEAAKAHASLRMTEGQLANRKQANLDVASQIMGVKVGGKGATRDSITEQYLSMLDSQLDQGQWVAGGENFAHIIAGWLEVDEADLAGTATDIVNNLKNAIRTAMAGGPIASNKLRASAKSVLGGEEAALRKDAGYTELEQKVQTGVTHVQDAEIAATEALSTLQAANNNVEQTRQLLEEIQTQMARLKQLQDEYNAAVDAQHKEQIDAARQGVSTAKSNTKAGTLNASEEASKAAGRTAQGTQENFARIQAIRQAAEAQAKADAIAAKESEQFSANLQASISRWMSAQQVINMVKQGIRQAYQDIQGLDSAMTNIAVVTDMSVGDLWGKINDYMGIAQQYGVTTQGVYEVSQLYYQQGLSTNEVMEATTETLKMARIAGMGYAEAADAMTVAIRAFKMEMSDAGHVTDVYSKVAAITASDSEELAIAMSKTASSAENVGSSFENTTAMLAVMIETTRESAQNLGSALKSIISRYGEMKQGLTQDSDGEIIDYNKTDAALRSIGISIKDAQGQFRDFDDVIFELSSKWDSLDKNTQRYIATIMAGNRQQSRFIALVDNWERLDEVASSAQDSEDAGLLQYAKTLDSLESKINNLKTNFQQFYMSIFNGEFFKGAVDIINNFVQSLSRVGPLLGTINLLQLINQIKLIGSLLINSFSKSISKVHNANKEWQNAFTQGWTPVGERIADALAAAILKKASGVGKEFVNRVKAETENTTGTTPASRQNQQQPSQQQNNPVQAYSTKALGKASQILHTWSPLTASALGEYGAVQDRTSIFENANPDEVNEAYQKQAEIILNAGDQFGEAAKKWANRVQEAGKNFGEDVDDAAKQEGLKELNAADIEAQKEIASAEAESAKEKAAKLKAWAGTGLMVAGTALSSAGMMMDQSTMKGYDTSTGLQAAGGALSAIGQAATGNYVGAAITAITTVVTTFQRISERAKAELENAEKAVESANAERAEKKEELRSLSDYAKKLREVEAARFDSNEAEEEWLNLNNEIAEKYPELISYIDSEGNSIVNLTADYDGLTTARLEAAEATALYYREQQKLYKLKAIAAKQSTAKEITTSPWDMHNVLFYGNTDTQAAFQNAYRKLFKQTGEGNINLNPEGGYLSNLARLHEIDALDDFILRTFGLTEEEMLSLLDSWNGDEPALSAESYRNISTKTGLALIERLLAEGYQPGNYFASRAERDQPFTIRGIKKLLGDELMPDEEAAAILEEYEAEGISAIISRGVGLYDLIQAASSGDLELAQIARSIGTSAGVLEYSSETNSWGLSSNQDKIQQWKDVEQYAMLSESNARAWASSEGAIYLYNTAAQETLTAIDGYEEILLNRAIILAGGADKLGSFIEGSTRVDGQLITLEDVYTTYAEEVATWYSGLSSANQELLQSLLSSSTSYTLEEMQNSLGKMGLSESENPEIYKAIMQTWYTDNYTAKYRGMKAIWGDTIEVMSLDQWKASDRYGERQAGLTDEEAYYQYTQGILNQLETDDVDLKNILQTASLQQQNQFISWWKVQKELIEKSEGYAADIINARLTEVTSATKQLLDEQDTILNLGEASLDISTLDQDARTTLFNLLTSENLGTSESIDEIINFLVSQGIVVDETVRKVLEAWIYENINTRIATLIDDIDNFVTKLSDLSSKQEKGLTFAESESYLKQLQKLKPNTSWDSYFQIDEKGLITFIDFGSSLKELYQAQIEQYNNETKYLNDYILKSLGFDKENNIFGISSLDSVLEDTDLANILNYTGEGISAAEEDLRNALKQANFKDSDIDFIIQQIKSGHFKTKEDIDNYFKELSANITSGTDYLIAQYQASLRDLGFTNATKVYTDNTQIKNLLEGGSVADLQNLWLKSLTDNTSVTVNGKALEYKSGEWDDKYWEQYYTDKMSELQGAHFDAYGQLIITDYEAYAKYIAALQGWAEEDDAYKNLMQNARSAQISAQETASDSIQTGLEELYTTAIQEQEISWNEVSNLMSVANLDAETQAEVLTAYENAKRKGITGYVAFIDYLTKIIQDSSNGSELDIAALNAAKRDARNGLISSLVSSLNQGLEGTLTNADFDALIEQIGGAPEAYRKYVTETFEGLKISAEGVLAITADLIKEFHNADLIVGSVVTQLIGSDTLGSYKDIEEYIEKVENGTIDWGEETSNVLNILYKMKNEYSQLAEGARFDFMNQDHFDGAADNWYTFTDNMSTAIDTLKSAFEKGGKIDYKSFDNIITWISDLSVAGLDTKLGETGVTLGQFTDAVLATVDATGNLDLSAAAANLGISMDDMAGALEGGLQEVAKQQVAYWKKYLDFLKGLKKLQDAQAEVQLEIPIKNETTGKWTYKGNTYDSWEALAAVYEGDVAAAQQYFENFSYTGANGTTITLSGENNPLNFILGKIGAFDLEGNLDLKEGMAAQIGQYMAQVYAWIDTLTADDIKKYVNEDTGEITIPWDEVLQIELDTSTTPEVNTTNAGEAGEQTQEVAEKAAESALTASGATPNGDGSYSYTLDGMTLKIQMGANGAVEIDLTNATGTLPSASELRKVFEGQEGFTATDDNNWVFTDPNLGFSVKCSNGTISFDTSNMTAPAAPTAAELGAILGATWTTADGGKTYTTSLNGVSFVYTSATGEIDINASSFQLTGGLDATSLATILGGAWTTEDGIIYKSAINDVTFTYESTTGKLVVTPPTTVTEPTNAAFATLMQAQGWAHENGVYTKDFDGGTLTYNATAGTLNITPSATMAAANPDMATLLDSAFGAGGWQPNQNGGYDILNATTGEVLYTLPAKITIAPTADSNVTLGENGLTTDVDVTLTPNTGAIDDALSAYEGKTINLTIGISKNSSIKFSQHFEEAAAALFGTSEWDTLLNTKNWSFLNGSNQDLAEEAFGSLVTQASVLSGANQLTQEDIDLITALGEAMEEAGINVSTAMETLSSLTAIEDNTVLTDLTAFAEAFGGANLFGNLTALTALLTAMTNPAAVSLDLTGFTTQLQSMGELELDDEEINAFVAAITALTTAIAALPTEVDVSVKVSAGNSYSVINNIKNALAGIKNKTVTVTTKHINSGDDGGNNGDENPDAPTDANYAGNVSGLALARGNATDKLLAGAHLAGKTLVGELGPELAVYDNQYHLLGRDGAEFVDLPNDAIVFNHRQTAGIIKDQAGYRGQALVNGNVTGPAAAGGIDAAISSVEKIIKLWSNIADSSLSDLLSGGNGGGGSGNTIKAVTEELQEWYNLSRQIADIEQEINNLIAERQNIAERNGDAYLRSLRKEQELLEQQAATQEILLGYQQLQLERQAEQINTNKIWSQFLEVNESGLLQYIKGNELNGGKGALEVLSELNEMSGEEQLKFLNNLGYTAVDQDGEKLDGQELIQKFFEELQLQIDEYDALYDTVHKTEETLENLQYKVEEINNQIIENQMDLEQDIFNILVDAWEEEIEALEEQKDLIEEANDAYVSGLNEALQAEREMYSEEQSIADREQLQRQLSLLRRSGGSASQIADLEQQLDSMLKDEYFRNQEQVIERIEDANEEQIRQLERQIKLQEEALEFEKEHGILWTKVYDIMAGSADQILNFMQGNSPEFFSQSLLQQEKMLTDWAKKIGIYTENKKYEGYEQDIQQSAWDSGNIWSYGAMSGYKSTYDSMTAEQQAAARKMFNTTYANARLAGDDHNTAIAKAQNALINNFKSYKEQQAASGNKPETDLNTGSGSETWYVTGPNKLNLRDQPSKSGNRLAQLPAGTKVKVLKKLDNGWFQVEVDGKTGYVDSQFLSKGTSGSSSNESSSNSNTSNSSSSGYRYKVTYSGTMSDGETDKPVSGSGMGNSEYEAKAVAKRYADAKVTGNWVWLNGGPTYRTIKLYSEGGLVDYTGPAIVHGTRSKPEAFLNAKQTAMISEAVKVAGDGGALDGIRTTLNKLDATIKSIVNNNKNETTSFTVAPGAVTIQVAQLNDSYDVEELSKDVMNRMVAIASKSTNRGVNRR